MTTQNSDFDLKHRLDRDSVFTIGVVHSINGREITVKVNKDKNLPHLFFQGKTIKNASVGLSNYVKIVKGFTEIICKIEGEYLEEDRFQTAKDYTSEKQKINRFLKVSVFGFYDDNRQFLHGIKELPLIGSECKLISKDEYTKLHSLADDNELSVKIGSLIDEETQDIRLSVKKLFAGHTGIFGNTGSGKSNTLAKLYTELFDQRHQHNNFQSKSKFIFIDFNGEYSKEAKDNIITENKTIYKLTTENNKGQRYPITKQEIEKIELLSILLDATEKTQQPFLNRAISHTWLDNDNDSKMQEQKATESVTRKLHDIFKIHNNSFSVPFLFKYIQDMQQLGFKIINKDKNKNFNDIKFHTGENKDFYFMKNGMSTYYNRNESQFIGPEGYLFVRYPESESLDGLELIQFKILDQYYHEVLNGYANQEHIGPLMGRLKKRFDMLSRVFTLATSEKVDNQCNIEVIDLKNVNLEIKKVIPLLICKNIYDEQKRRRNTDKKNSLHIIIDEAHNILSENSVRESDSWKDYRLETFEEIIKEGRKFGVFLTIASQRPSDISPTIISQLHNYFIHKLMNEQDLWAIKKAVSYLDNLSFNSISNLSVGCCFVAGQMTQFPLSLKVELLEEDRRPQSGTIDLNDLWTNSDSAGSMTFD